MPTIIDLFKERTVTIGPNAGKTMQEATAAQNSKIVDIQTTNPTLQSFANKINKRRKEQGLVNRETRLEQESVGLKALSDTSKLILYGGDYFRIINKTTRSKQVMLKNTGVNNAGLDDRIADKLGSALGSFVGDKISNALQKTGDKLDPPPKLDIKAVGMDIGADVLSSTLGRLLPDPMIPSKVAQEYTKGKTDKKPEFIHEYDLDKRNKILNSRKAVPKYLDNLLKNNKDILSQGKDAIISTGASIAGGLISLGVKELNKLIFNKAKNNKGGAQQNTQPTTSIGWKYSSEDYYTKRRGNIATLKNGDAWSRLDLSAFFLLSREANYSNFLKTNNQSVPTNIRAELNQEPDKYSSYDKFTNQTGIYKKRGMSDGADALNIMNSIVYSGTEAQDSDKRSLDDYDFIPLKFYNIYKNETLQLRCTISDLTETFTPSWDTNKFLGNPFNFYTYQSIERTLTFSFKIFSLNLMEHQFNWERINELASYTYPTDYKGVSGAVVPPIIKLTIGNMYKNKECIIDNLTFSVDEDTPWEIGLNKKLTAPILPKFLGGFVYSYDENNSADNYKLPMIINVEMSVKFLENRNNTSPNTTLYSYVDNTPSGKSAITKPTENAAIPGETDLVRNNVGTFGSEFKIGK